MSLELLNTVATLATFLVITATAAAAIVQLRHLSASNHITALNELRETIETVEFQSARHFIETELKTKLQDPTFREHLMDRTKRTEETRPLIAKIIMLGNFYESLGMLMKVGLVDKDLALEMWCGVITDCWDRLEEAIVLIRQTLDDTVFENFEYATVLAQDWQLTHPHGTYPAGMRRLALAS